MKKRVQLIVRSIILVGLMSFTLASATKEINSSQSVTEASTCKHGQCKGTAKSTGLTCKHCVSNAGDKYCYQHK